MIQPDKILKAIMQWENDPQAMFDWRSKAIKTTMLVLESIISEEVNPKSRTQMMGRIRAAEQLTRLFKEMAAMRADVPVVCPHCEKEFIVP